MDWPTAAPLVAAIVGCFGAIIVALIKWMPRKLVNGNGERFATQVQHVEMMARVASLEREAAKEGKYVHDAIHDIRDFLQAIEIDLIRAGIDSQTRHQLLHEQHIRRERSDREK